MKKHEAESRHRLMSRAFSSLPGSLSNINYRAVKNV